MQDDLTSASPFSEKTLEEIEKYFDETIGKAYAPTFHSGKVFLQKTKERLAGVTVNEKGYAAIQSMVPPKPDEMLTPSVAFRGELASLYSGVKIFLVEEQIREIIYWFDQDSLDLYLSKEEIK